MDDNKQGSPKKTKEDSDSEDGGDKMISSKDPMVTHIEKVFDKIKTDIIKAAEVKAIKIK